MGNQQSRHRIPNNSAAPMDTQQPPRLPPIISVAPMDTHWLEDPNNSFAPMDTQQPPRRVLKIKFRVLIIGRANAGKTSILQRVCETTESPVIFRGNNEVLGPTFLSASLISLLTSINLTRQWRLVTKIGRASCRERV